jgi:muconolactone delta-isomerase
MLDKVTQTSDFNSYHVMAMLDDVKRIEIARARDLAAQGLWSANVWQRSCCLLAAKPL